MGRSVDLARGPSRPPILTSALCGLTTALALLASVVSPLAQTFTATQPPPAYTTFFNANGAPLAGGQVYMYVPNTTVPKTTWLDPYEQNANSSPVTLDSAGKALIFGQGNYRQQVYDVNHNLIWDGLTTAIGSSAPSGSTGTDTAPVGTVLAWSGFNYNIPTNWMLAYGEAVSRTTFAQLLAVLTIATSTGSCTNSSTTVGGFADTSNIPIGAPIESSCLPTNDTVASIVNSTTVTVSAAATATGSFTVTVFPWGNGDGATTYNLPDLRGRTFAGADAMGGTAANRLTSTYFGPSAGPPASVGGIQNETATSTFSIARTNLPTYTLPNTLGVTGTVTLNSIAGTIVNGQSSVGIGGGNNAVINGSLSTSFSGSVTGGVTLGGSSTPLVATSANFATIQPTITVNYIIKVAPNSTGSGGVISIGGMFGDILCGSGVVCSNQTISVNTTGGTVTSVSLALPNIFTVTGSPVTTAGTLTGALASQNANIVFAGPGSGSAAAPTFRSLVTADLAGVLLGAAQGGTGANNSAATGVAQWASGTYSVSTIIANGATATTQTSGDNTALLATDAFVTAAVQAAASGLTPHTPVLVATTADLGSVTYNNGSSGVGATITNAGTQVAFSVDGVSPAGSSRVLVKNQTTQLQNGIYTLTTVGSGSSNWVLTRATDANQPGTGSATLIGAGTYVLVTSGSTQTSSSWAVNSTVTTIGTSAINWVQFSAAFTGVVSLGGQSGVLGLDASLSFSGSTLACTTATASQKGCMLPDNSTLTLSGSTLALAAINVAGATSGTQLLNGTKNALLLDVHSGSNDYASVSGAPWFGIASALGAL